MGKRNNPNRRIIIVLTTCSKFQTMHSRVASEKRDCVCWYDMRAPSVKSQPITQQGVEVCGDRGRLERAASVALK